MKYFLPSLVALGLSLFSAGVSASTENTYEGKTFEQLVADGSLWAVLRELASQLAEEAGYGFSVDQFRSYETLGWRAGPSQKGSVLLVHEFFSEMTGYTLSFQGADGSVKDLRIRIPKNDGAPDPTAAKFWVINHSEERANDWVGDSQVLFSQIVDRVRSWSPGSPLILLPTKRPVHLQSHEIQGSFQNADLSVLEEKGILTPALIRRVMDSLRVENPDLALYMQENGWSSSPHAFKPNDSLPDWGISEVAEAQSIFVAFVKTFTTNEIFYRNQNGFTFRIRIVPTPHHSEFHWGLNSNDFRFGKKTVVQNEMTFEQLMQIISDHVHEPKQVFSLCNQHFQ